MPRPVTDYFAAAEVVAAAREIIRRESGGCCCVISIGELLDELSNKFGDRFVSPDMHKLLDLIQELWAEPNIDQVTDAGWIEFAWNEEFDQADVTELKASAAAPGAGDDGDHIGTLEGYLAEDPQ